MDCKNEIQSIIAIFRHESYRDIPILSPLKEIENHRCVCLHEGGQLSGTDQGIESFIKNPRNWYNTMELCGYQ